MTEDELPTCKCGTVLRELYVRPELGGSITYGCPDLGCPVRWVTHEPGDGRMTYMERIKDGDDA